MGLFPRDYPTFQCPKCKGYRTEDRGKEGICWDCHAFFTMGEKEINWWAVKWFVISLIIIFAIMYLVGI